MRRSPLLCVVLATAAVAGCTGDSAPPSGLLDGSPTSSGSVRLEGVDQPLVLTRVRSLELDDTSGESSIRPCLQRYEGFAKPGSPLVERIGVHSASVTFPDDSGRWLLGCDSSAGAWKGDSRWCGGVPGRLYGGRLRDVRLSIASCATAEGEPVGFAWIQPDPSARFVAVAQPGFAEVYEAAGDLQIRIATISGVLVEESRARFDVSEHDAEGNLIREYELEARVAG